MNTPTTQTLLSRRSFVKAAGAGALAFPTLIPSRVLGDTAPSKQITLGFIGVGGQGVNVNLNGFLPEKDCRVVMVCDAHMGKARQAQQIVNERYGNTDCQAVQDFREVLADPAIDAVVISTPDHWHVTMSLMAMRAGKHVFCEKPTHSIHEGRILTDAFTKSDRVFQAGIEDRSAVHFHKMVEWVKNGAIGELQRVEVSMPGGMYYKMQDPKPVPEDLDWNLWQGPAAYREFFPARINPGGWRQHSLYAKGAIIDMGTHLVDTAQLGVNDPDVCPVEVTGTGEIPEGMLTDVPVSYDLNYRYGNGVEMHVFNGSTKGWDPQACVLEFHGSKGWIKRVGWGGKIEASERDILRKKYTPEQNKHWTRPPREQRDFLDGIQTGKRTTYPPIDLHHMSTTLHMGVISIELGRTLNWDPQSEAFLGDDEANAKRSLPPARDWESAS
ncbi:Gfo/Idh/MocA family protein [Algisphaera agarilytica]|uniref:Putative dehydrogenase n=1 Tax=Algisphaera agarilytica TaxID=1385975 RepID=A0A7X0LJ50_9BACT|nr:Gfo/Idh/MocA family oxidoreductase [Algisphaera agarilytica]MBB6428925.1 putative dehydrogenase [Algisphaera agarilytica]